MNRLKQLRKEANMTQQDLANMLNYSKSIIAMYEKEIRKPSAEVLVKLANIFNCSIDFILNKSNIRNSSQIADPFGLSEVGFNINDYSPPSIKQKEQIAELIKIILKDNKK